MVKILSNSIASGASVSSAIRIADFDRVFFDIPTFSGNGGTTTTCNVYALVGDTETGTFRNLRLYGAYSAGVAIAAWEVPSSTGNYRVEVPCEGWNYVKVQVSNNVSSTMSANVVVLNSRPK